VQKLPFPKPQKSDWLKGLVLYNKNRPQRGEIYGALGRKLTDFDNLLIFHKTLK
jgi:hypothetical protein